jgi:glutamine synthetase
MASAEEHKEKLGQINNVFKLIKDKEIKMIDFRFTDMVGGWQHFSVPTHRLTEESFYEGFGFDGSSIRGWKQINESDMLCLPDPSTAQIDSFIKVPTLSMICDIFDPISKQYYDMDPRFICKKALEYLKSTGIADSVFFGPEAEFFILRPRCLQCK